MPSILFRDAELQILQVVTPSLPSFLSPCLLSPHSVDLSSSGGVPLGVVRERHIRCPHDSSPSS